MRDSSPDQAGRIGRRGFLGAGAGALAAASFGEGRPAAAQAPAQAKVVPVTELPKRPLGRTGVDVSILNLGTWMSPGGDRLLRYAWAQGIRYLDTASNYGSEPMIARWLAATPGARKDLFLVTKDSPNTPRQLLWHLDQRLAALQTDYVDLIFVHGLGDRNFDADLQALPQLV